MPFSISEPSFYPVVKVIIKPRFELPARNLESSLSIILVHEDGTQLSIASLHSHNIPIEMEVVPYSDEHLTAIAAAAQGKEAA
jgi:hypothetical protein